MQQQLPFNEIRWLTSEEMKHVETRMRSDDRRQAFVNFDDESIPDDQICEGYLLEVRTCKCAFLSPTCVHVCLFF